MADLISQKLISSQNVSQVTAYTSSAEDKSSKTDERTFGDKLRENKTNIIASGLITGGAILLYLGLTRPGKSDVLSKYTDEQMKKMDSAVKKFYDYVVEKVEVSFKEPLSFISDYRKTHIVNPADYVSLVKVSDDAQKVVAAQDIAFSTLNKTVIKGGANDRDEFATLFRNIMHRVRGEISGQQNRTTLELKDYRTLPHCEETDKELISNAEVRLESKHENILDYMERIKNTKLNIVERFQFGQIADAITESRLSKTRTKESVLDTAFEKIREALNLDKDFVPVFRQSRYDLSEIKSLDRYLKPHSIPEKFLKDFEPDNFINILKDEDLSKWTDDDLRKAFWQISRNYNLKDLRYLIDRIRLHEVTAASQKDTEKFASVYKAMEIKLKHLSNVLNEYGEKELLRCCDCDFGKLNPYQKEAKMISIDKVSRRLGYENFSIMNRELLKTNERYMAMELPKFAEEIESHSELYFVG